MWQRCGRMGGCTGNETIQGSWSPSWNGNLDTAGPRSISLMGQKTTSLQFSLAEEEGEDDAKSMLGCAWMIGASDKKGCTWARSQRSSDVRLLGVVRCRRVKTTARRAV
jgi:hypothetical protein